MECQTEVDCRDNFDICDEDSDSSEYSSDGFWSGRLRDRKVAEQAGCRTVVGAGYARDECRFRDPRVKTFAWWQAALCQQERDRVVVKPGQVLGEVDLDSEKGEEFGVSEDEMEWMGRACGWKRRRVTPPSSPSADTEALWAQWL